MHQLVESIVNELDQISSQLRLSVPNDEPFAIAHNNWSFPLVTRVEIIEVVQRLSARLKESAPNQIVANEARLQDYLRRLQFFRTNVVPNMWSGAHQGVPSLLGMVQFLEQAFGPTLEVEPKDESARLARLRQQVRAMETRASDLGSRTQGLEDMVGRIERAHSAADQLPTDLEELKGARREIEKIRKEAEQDRALVKRALQSVEAAETSAATASKAADDVLFKAERAYSAATSIGLAKSFSERSSGLSLSVWTWVVLLAVALLGGGAVGTSRLERLLESLTSMQAGSGASGSLIVVVNAVLALMSFGGTVWFAWLSTRQISERFKLAEDYGFKAAVASAYEGFRKEAQRVDPELEKLLLKTAIARLDELPLRVLEEKNYGSPVHELVNAPVVGEIVAKAGEPIELLKSVTKALPGAKSGDGGGGT